MTRAEPSKSQPIPAERQAARLSGAILAKKTEIEEVLRRHADPIKTQNEKVEKAEKNLERTKFLVKDNEDRRLRYLTVIEGCKAKLKGLIDEAVKLGVEGIALTSEESAAASALATATSEREVKLSEPNRHVAALGKDLKRLERRLTLNKARRPLTALFSGSRLPEAEVSADDGLPGNDTEGDVEKAASQ